MTLVEVLLSIVILGVSVVAISDAYHTGLRALDAQASESELDAAIRARMETLLAEDFAALTGGQADVTVGGTSHKISWTVSPVDLDGDVAAEYAARHVVVTLRDRSMEVIVADHGGWVAKL
jgi:hypothetical protein